MTPPKIKTIRNQKADFFNQAYLLFRCIVELIPCLSNFDFHSDLEMNPFFCVCGISMIAQFLLLRHLHNGSSASDADRPHREM
jgi:hypothetical protein